MEVINKTDRSRYANGNDKRLVNLSPIALTSIFKLTTSSGNHLEDIIHAHNVFSVYTPRTSAKDADDLSFGFDRDRNKKEES